MNQVLIRSVWERANHRCEYCHIPAVLYSGCFHVDHVRARQHGGATEFSNLALACMHCNRHKGPNIAGSDPETGEIVRLFDPRRDVWSEHFTWRGEELVGRTAIGRATVFVLAVNEPELQAMREALRDDEVAWE